MLMISSFLFVLKHQPENAFERCKLAFKIVSLSDSLGHQKLLQALPNASPPHYRRQILLETTLSKRNMEWWHRFLHAGGHGALFFANANGDRRTNASH